MWTPPIFRKRVKPHAVAQYHQGDIWLGGAESKVYEPALPWVPAILPPVQLIGNAIYAGPPPSPIQGVQVYANQTMLIAGIGGVLSGQVINQPLNIPDTTNGSQ
jgi:hypothetical protein